MPIYDITVPAKSGIGGTDAAADAIAAPPGDFDGAVINSVVIVGSPTITSDGQSDDSLTIRWAIQNDAFNNTYGNVSTDGFSLARAPLGDSEASATIIGSGSTSPAPTIAVAADWDQVRYSCFYSANMMADAETVSWNAWTIRVTYTPIGPPDIISVQNRWTTPVTGAAHEAWNIIGSPNFPQVVALDTGYALIVKIGNTGAASSSQTYQLEYNVEGAGWNDVNGSSANVRAFASGDVDDATSTTERLTSSSRTFANSILDEVNGAIDLAAGAISDNELYFSIEFRSADLSGNERIEFRVTAPTDTVDMQTTPIADVDGDTDIRQSFYRFCQPVDGGVHNGWDLVGTENVSFEIVLDTDYALVVKITNRGDAAASQAYQLEYNVDAAGWNDVNATSSNVRPIDSGGDDDDTFVNERLTDTQNGYGFDVLDEIDGEITAFVVEDDRDYELYFALEFRSADLSGGETIEFRVTAPTDAVSIDITPTATVPGGGLKTAAGTITFSGDLTAIGSNIQLTPTGTITLSGDLAGIGQSFAFATGTITMTGACVSRGTTNARGTITVLGDLVADGTHLTQATIGYIGELIAGGGTTSVTGTSTFIGDLVAVGQSLGGLVTAAGTITFAGDLVSGGGTTSVTATSTTIGDLAAIGQRFVFATATITVSGDLVADGTLLPSLAVGTITLSGDLAVGGGTTSVTATSTTIGELSAVGNILPSLAAGTSTTIGSLAALGTILPLSAAGTITFAGDLSAIGASLGPAAGTITLSGDLVADAVHLAAATSTFSGDLTADGYNKIRAVKFEVVQLSAPTSTGTQSFTKEGFGTPKAAVFFMTNCIANGTLVNDLSIGVGFTDGTSVDDLSVAMSDEHVPPGQTNSHRIYQDGKCICLIEPLNSPNIIAEADWNAWVTDGVEIDWTTVPPNGYQVNCLLIGGEEVTVNAVSERLDDEEDLLHNVAHGLGETPVLAFVLSSLAITTSAEDNVETDARMSFGVVTHQSSIINQVSIGNWIEDNENPSEAHSVISDTYAVSSIDGAGAFADWEVTEIDGTNLGFRLRNNDGNINVVVLILSIGFGSATNKVELDTYASRTTTGTTALTNSSGFRPQFIMLGATGTPTVNTPDITNNYGFGLGIIDLDNEYSVSVAATDNDAIPTASISMADDTAMRMLVDDGTLKDAYTATILTGSGSINADGFTLDYIAENITTIQQNFWLMVEEDVPGFKAAQGTITLIGDLAGIGTNLILLASGTITASGDLAADGKNLAQGTSTTIGDLSAIGSRFVFPTGTITFSGDLVAVGENLIFTASGTITASGDLVAVGEDLTAGFISAAGTITVSGDLGADGKHLGSGTSTTIGDLATDGRLLAAGTSTTIGDLAASGGSFVFATGTITWGGGQGGFTHIGTGTSGDNSATASRTHGLTILAGDLVVAYVHANGGSQGITDDGGGTTFNNPINTDPDSVGETAWHALYWKIAGGSEPAAYTWTLDNSNNWRVVLKVFRPTGGTPVVDLAAIEHLGTSGSTSMVCEAPNGRSISAGALSIVTGGKDGRTGPDLTAADESYVDVSGNHTNQATGIAHRIFSSAATLNTVILTPTGGSDFIYSTHISFLPGGGERVTAVGTNLDSGTSTFIGELNAIGSRFVFVTATINFSGDLGAFGLDLTADTLFAAGTITFLSNVAANGTQLAGGTSTFSGQLVASGFRFSTVTAAGTITCTGNLDVGGGVTFASGGSTTIGDLVAVGGIFIGTSFAVGKIDFIGDLFAAGIKFCPLEAKGTITFIGALAAVEDPSDDIVPASGSVLFSSAFSSKAPHLYKSIEVILFSDRHTGPNNHTFLIDVDAEWGSADLTGLRLQNVGDESDTTITGNTDTEVFGTLQGGAGNDWDFNDLYRIYSLQRTYAQASILITGEISKANLNEETCLTPTASIIMTGGVVSAFGGDLNFFVKTASITFFASVTAAMITSRVGSIGLTGELAALGRNLPLGDFDIQAQAAAFTTGGQIGPGTIDGQKKAIIREDFGSIELYNNSQGGFYSISGAALLKEAFCLINWASDLVAKGSVDQTKFATGNIRWRAEIGLPGFQGAIGTNLASATMPFIGELAVFAGQLCQSGTITFNADLDATATKDFEPTFNGVQSPVIVGNSFAIRDFVQFFMPPVRCNAKGTTWIDVEADANDTWVNIRGAETGTGAPADPTGSFFQADTDIFNLNERADSVRIRLLDELFFDSDHANFPSIVGQTGSFTDNFFFSLTNGVQYGHFAESDVDSEDPPANPPTDQEDGNMTFIVEFTFRKAGFNDLTVTYKCKAGADARSEDQP